jgi:hypothetical protein
VLQPQLLPQQPTAALPAHALLRLQPLLEQQPRQLLQLLPLLLAAPAAQLPVQQQLLQLLQQ